MISIEADLKDFDAMLGFLVGDAELLPEAREQMRVIAAEPPVDHPAP